MRLVAKLTLSFLAVTLVVLLWAGFARISRNLDTYREDRLRAHRRIGQTLALAVAAVARTDGREAAHQTVRRAEIHAETVRIRWICDPNEVPEATFTSCAELLALPVAEDRHGEWTGDAPARRFFTYVPVLAGDARYGALEVSESTQAEGAFVRRVARDTLLTTLVLVTLNTAVSFAMGVWLVGDPVRRLRRTARALGEGRFDARANVQHRDELGDLGADLDAASEQLRAARDGLERETAGRIEALEQLRHADRLSTVGQLASGVAHEIGTPLNVIEARAAMIAAGDTPADRIADSARRIVEACERITRTVQQLLAFSRPGSTSHAAMDLRESVLGAVELVRPLAHRRRVTLDAPDGDGAVIVEADAVQLQQALGNLLVNAIQASPEGSRVTVALGRERRPRARTEPAESERDWAVVSVIDHGEGIPADHLARIFEPFFTTKGVGEGTGLGLSVTYGIVTEHGGWLDVQSAPGSGARFDLYLPRTA